MIDGEDCELKLLAGPGQTDRGPRVQLGVTGTDEPCPAHARLTAGPQLEDPGLGVTVGPGGGGHRDGRLAAGNTSHHEAAIPSRVEAAMAQSGGAKPFFERHLILTIQ